MIVSGFCKEVFKELPMEFALEAQALLGITLEGSRRIDCVLRTSTDRRLTEDSSDSRQRQSTVLTTPDDRR